MVEEKGAVLEAERIQLAGISKYLILPVALMALLSLTEPSFLKVGFFATAIILYSVIFPWLDFAKLPRTREVINPKSVDLVYYSLAILGTFFFYLANSVTPAEFDNRKSASDVYRNLAFLEWFNPDSVFSQKRYLDALKVGLLEINQRYLDRENQRVDECAPQNFDQYDFCETEKALFRAAESHINRGYLSVARPRDRRLGVPSVEVSREVLARMEPLGVPIVFEHKRYGTHSIVFKSTTLFDYMFLRGDGAKFIVDEAFEDGIRPLITQAEARVDYLEEEYLELRGFGAISGIVFFLGNTWPYVLMMALGLKLARNRYSIAAM